MLSKQTLIDLNVFPSNSNTNSLFEQLNYCKTNEGKELLRDKCYLKDCSLNQIELRRATVKYLATRAEGIHLTINDADIYYTQQYLGSSFITVDSKSKIASKIQSASVAMFNTHRHYVVLNGVTVVAKLINNMQHLCDKLYSQEMPELIGRHIDTLQNNLTNLGIPGNTHKRMLEKKMPLNTIYQLDERLRLSQKQSLLTAMAAYYELEVLISLAFAHNALQLSFPELTNLASMYISDLYHPLIPGCVTNSIAFREQENLMIITGPNMAGKSTLMKSIGIAFLLAYLGIGIPASGARIPVVDNIVTSINIEDNVVKGYSFFFSEVQNIKSLAAQLQKGKKLLVIADELFKGTNIKDATDCSELVLNGFLKHPGSIFIISTHLNELAQLFVNAPACILNYFDAAIDESNNITFHYKLLEGRSDLRLGLAIFKQEGILF